MACDVLTKNQFIVEIGNPGGLKYEVGYFKSISGLSKSILIEELTYNGGNSKRLLPKGIKLNNITLQRAVLYQEEEGRREGFYLRDWYYQVYDPHSKVGSTCGYFRDVDIYVLDREGNKRKKIALSLVWPKRYRFPDLDAMDSDIGYEEVELVPRKIRLEIVPYTASEIK
jgi:phage tail-like protein